jgi:hypothetical protein
MRTPGEGGMAVEMPDGGDPYHTPGTGKFKRTPVL